MALERLTGDFEKALERLKEACLRAKDSNKSDYQFLEIVVFKGLSLPLKFSGSALNPT